MLMATPSFLASQSPLKRSTKRAPVCIFQACARHSKHLSKALNTLLIMRQNKPCCSACDGNRANDLARICCSIKRAAEPPSAVVLEHSLMGNKGPALFKASVGPSRLKLSPHVLQLVLTLPSSWAWPLLWADTSKTSPNFVVLFVAGTLGGQNMPNAHPSSPADSLAGKLIGLASVDGSRLAALIHDTSMPGA